MRDAITLNWPGGEHDFKLTIGELRALDDRCHEGVYAAWVRLRAGLPRIDDVQETVRLGLIGGGMEAKAAGVLVAKVEEAQGIGPLIPIASLIVFRAFFRREEKDEEPGKDQAPEATQD